MPPVTSTGSTDVYKRQEGTGALCAIPMLDMACSVYQGSTFGELSIEAYEEQDSQL